MSVRQMLASMDSREIAEWEAYERATGPLGASYQKEVLAQLHEQLQVGNWLAGEQFEENPIDIPQRFVRPPEAFIPVEEEQSMNPAEFDAQFD